jgi:hypothetical protein
LSMVPIFQYPSTEVGRVCCIPHAAAQRPYQRPPSNDRRDSAAVLAVLRLGWEVVRTDIAVPRNTDEEPATYTTGFHSLTFDPCTEKAACFEKLSAIICWRRNEDADGRRGPWLCTDRRNELSAVTLRDPAVRSNPND